MKIDWKSALKNPRVIIALVGIIAFVLPWARLTMSALGYSEDLGVYSGLNLMSSLVFLLFLVPVAVIVIEIFFSELKFKKTLYLIITVVSVIGHFLFVTIALKKYHTGLGMYSGLVDIKTKWLIGFWLSLACAIAILVFTLIKDFGVSKKTLNKEGFKSLVDDVKKDIPTNIKITTEGTPVTPVIPTETAPVHDSATENNTVPPVADATPFWQTSTDTTDSNDSTAQ